MTKKTSKSKVKVISLFSGAMGLDLGLESAGLEVAVAVEANETAAQTIRANRPNLAVIEKPIQDVTTKEILTAAGLKPGEAFAVVGGPSCQAFSTAGSRNSLGDDRGSLFEHFVRVVEEARPEFFVMENVRGLISAAVKHRKLKERGPGFPPLEPEEELGTAFAIIATAVRKTGYYSIFDVLNSANYGTPQARERLIVLGSRDGKKLCMPTPTHSKDPTGELKKWSTLAKAIKPLRNGIHTFNQFSESQLPYFEMIPEGGNWRSMPEKVQETAMGGAYNSWGGRCGFYRRLSYSKPSPSLTTQPRGKATSLCHPEFTRPLSVEEYAAIQQFPRQWRFSGGIAKQYIQVGNAVPVGLGSAIGSALISAKASRASKTRLGRIECLNLKMLADLLKRPRTIMNPERMWTRDYTEEEYDFWTKAAGMKRLDPLNYVADEHYEKLIELSGIALHTQPIPAAEFPVAELLEAAE